ncbi:hypothetical protein [uncultured Tateyamaria sp.]|uniref:hypothetical protein n=1 Tax=uncultured Tateyamaria sp. TaxID=455651 RepID=UPI002624652B|nr:hypothetical protein [uncultured Tateyamaria sp.]
MSREEQYTYGENVLDLIRHNYGETKTARAEFAALFDRKPASVWPWVGGDRQGIPAAQRQRFEVLLKNRDIKLPPNTQVDMYVRPAPRRDVTDKAPKRNVDLLTLIWNVVRHDALGPTALEALMADTNFIERQRTPALLFRWAYHEGGVPKSYQEAFSNALVRSGIAGVLLEYDDDPHGLFDIRVSSFFAE